MNTWAAFWICLAIFIAAEAWLASKGLDTAIWQFRTPAELELQQRLIERAGK
jgi:hypothetical protein